MPITMVTGAAGYGKTCWILEQVGTMTSNSDDVPHRRLLAMSRMHGGRRRIDAALGERYPRLPRTVATVDSFALGLVNRWRRSLGVSRPFVIGRNEGNEGLFGMETSFDQVLKRAIDLMRACTVRSFVASTYPLVVIDEFQDCHGHQLELVQALTQCSSLVLAADEFQLLESSVSGCPAVEWVTDLAGRDQARIVPLTTCHRTADQRLLNTTRALRADVATSGESIAVFACPSYGPAAYRIVERLVYGHQGPPWKGTCAMLTPTNDSWTEDVLTSCRNQLERKRRPPIHWAIETSEDQARDRLLKALQVADDARAGEQWQPPPTSGEPLVKETIEHVSRVSRSRGIRNISRGDVAYLAQRLLHAFRTRGYRQPKRVVSTIHAAKNREFDHVFVLWPYDAPDGSEFARRLLYNAVSRARVSAMVLVRGELNRCTKSAVLRLLGPAPPAIPVQTGQNNRKRSGNKPSVTR